MADRETVATDAGDAAITWHRAAGRARLVLGLGHGAGGGIEAPDLVALAAALPARGVTVALVEQPWRVAGRKVAPAPKTLDTGWLPVARRLAAEGLPLVVGGRSAGARVACRTGAGSGAAAVLALAFPLHPPGKPEKSRAEELLGTGLPTLVVQGEKDTFGTPAEFPELPAGHRLAGVPFAGHGFAVPKKASLSQPEALALVVRSVADWLDGLAL
ncbi:putative alpha/beta-hydrolase family hydrolase [Kitasatospora sp. GP30]|uniref:alpha/beta hydrolase family protein n=1 Tax=Kitasatospora sp. GP30 TaxID=3035084 RepID=UPI000C704EA3|nr:alpha/beta family hydrolase [Kitasatospora sp. GP30]MDH6141687.1 putative alpha/beta-hydrolase family hydrolase [Kitasatospora sp. GP30]